MPSHGDEGKRPGQQVWLRLLVVHAVVVAVTTLSWLLLTALGWKDPAGVMATANVLLGIPWSTLVTGLGIGPSPAWPVEVIFGATDALWAVINVALHGSAFVLANSRGAAQPAPTRSGSPGAPVSRPFPLRVFGMATVLGLVVWAVWLGWDYSYYLVPPEFPGDTGHRGPYTPAQVVGCAATLGLVTAVLAARTHAVAAASGTTLGFWLPWTIWAMAQDDGGFAVLGSILLLAGLVAGTGVAAVIGKAVSVLLATPQDKTRLGRGR